MGWEGGYNMLFELGASLELDRLEAIEKAIREYSGENTYDGLIDWLESTTDFKRKEE
jgi:hypothetical protein